MKHAIQTKLLTVVTLPSLRFVDTSQVAQRQSGLLITVLLSM
jgi:hypothetical protein